jgi:very-short-patch-repair endonuclease
VAETTTAVGPVFMDEDAPPARSKAEAFLWLQLEGLPTTAGLFALNQPLGFRFGKREAEGDLTAAALRLVVELDGHWHFQDPAAYRRDRRKDHALQRHGWFLLRFLAEDVVFRLDEVLSTIEDSVAWCRAQSKDSAP